MAVLGLLLVLSAVGLTLGVAVQNTASINVDAFGQTVTLSSGWLFVAGAATGALGILGVAMLVGGLARARRRRAAFVESRSSVQELQAERDRLAEQLERERAEPTTTTAPRQHDARAEREPAVIDLADNRSAEPVSGYAVQRGSRREPASDRREAVESGRPRLFHRRH